MEANHGFKRTNEDDAICSTFAARRRGDLHACCLCIDANTGGGQSRPAEKSNSWAYQLQGYLSALARSGADVVVVDADHMRGAVSKLKTKPDGSRRVVIGYLAIGEVETYRSYYKSCCAGSKPDWLTSKTQGWAGNYVVHFWRPEWKAIVKSRVDQMMQAGFDGIYIDRVDTWENVKAPGSSRGAMIQLVKEVSGWTRSHNGNAAIMVQNGEELLNDSSYLSAIDAIAKEDLFHGIDHKGSRIDRQHHLQLAHAEERPIRRQEDLRHRISEGQHRRQRAGRDPQARFRTVLRTA